jgi:hypothetical protein
MSKTKITLFAAAAIIIAEGLVIATKMSTPASTQEGRGTIGATPAQPSLERALDPFTHVAYIPATVDPKTIHLKRLKTVDLASKTQTITNPQDCKDRSFRDPDGKNCEAVKVLERVKAVEAEYSYLSPEYSTSEGEVIPANRQTFSVYLHPEELPVSGPVEKLNREQAESLFQVSASRPIVQEKVVDNQRSHFCEGNYVDGNWIQQDPKCQPQVEYTTRTVPSESWAVTVDVAHPALAKR